MKKNWIIGQIYGDGNTLLEVLPNRGQYKFGRFECKCGNIFEARITAITALATRGCGCLEKIHNKIHGLSNNSLYNTWSNIKVRCYKTSDDHYKWYGARGITMSDEFKNNPQTFIDYIKSLPNYDKRTELKLELDRENNDGNYERGNLRWATRTEQNNNKRNSVRAFEIELIDGTDL